MVKNTSLLYAAHPTGHIIPGTTTKLATSDIDLDNVTLGGGLLVQTLALSSDPYLRGRMRLQTEEKYSAAYVLGEPLDNFGVGRVLRSEDSKFKPGDAVYGQFPFSEYFVTRADDSVMPPVKVEKIPGVPLSLYCGTLGMPGQTAYFGWKAFLEEKAKKSKTLFISGSAGPVGSAVIQFAKLYAPHLKVLASAGSKGKIDFMRSVGADVAFNYKEKDTVEVLKEHGPIDMYWDNVAGPTLDAALANMAKNGVIVACGAISGYNNEPLPIKNTEAFFARVLTVHGLLWFEFRGTPLMDAFYRDAPALVRDGKLRGREQYYEGIAGAERALVDVQTGKNEGKAVVIVAEE